MSQVGAWGLRLDFLPLCWSPEHLVLTFAPTHFPGPCRCTATRPVHLTSRWRDFKALMKAPPRHSAGESQPRWTGFSACHFLATTSELAVLKVWALSRSINVTSKLTEMPVIRPCPRPGGSEIQAEAQRCVLFNKPYRCTLEVSSHCLKSFPLSSSKKWGENF